ncbi:hypothetical protein MUB42_02680 [Apilactobacillus kunkeei]|nr:hypothetical protein MUB42_02680 [Apilactobacillus kunkeei]
MIDITEIACESYKEDLRSYDNPDYVITYPKYNWKMSYVAYDAMLNELTDYRNLNQPDTDYETFGFKSNSEVIYFVNCFFRFYDLFLINKRVYSNTKDTKGIVKGKNNLFYILREKIS